MRSTIASPTAITRGARRTIGSFLPESLTPQFLDDDLVLGGAAALGAEEAPVRVADGVRTFPSAESAHRVGEAHVVPQKKSSSVSFLSLLGGPSGRASAPLKASLSSDFCCAGCVPVKRAFSSQPYASVI